MVLLIFQDRPPHTGWFFVYGLVVRQPGRRGWVKVLFLPYVFFRMVAGLGGGNALAVQGKQGLAAVIDFRLLVGLRSFRFLGWVSFLWFSRALAGR